MIGFLVSGMCIYNVEKCDQFFFTCSGLVLNLHHISLYHSNMHVWCLQWPYIVVKCHHNSLVVFLFLFLFLFWQLTLNEALYIIIYSLCSVQMCKTLGNCHQFFFKCFRLLSLLLLNLGRICKPSPLTNMDFWP